MKTIPASAASNRHMLLRVLISSFILQLKDNRVNSYFVGALFIQPIVFTLLSVSLYQYGGKPDLAAYAMIGSGMIGIWNANLWNSGNIVRYERREGTLPLLVAAPTSLMVVLLGRSLANALASLGSLVITFATGFLAYGIVPSIANPISFIATLILTIMTMTSLGLIFGCIFVLTRSAHEFVQVINYPIFILSGLTFPFALLPLWTRPFSWLLGSTWSNIGLSQAAGFSGGSLALTYLWQTGLTIAYFIIATLLFQRVEHLVRHAGSMEEW